MHPDEDNDGRDLSDLTEQQLKAMDRMRSNGQRFIAVPSGFRLSVIGSDPVKAQLIELRRYGVEEGARCLGMPPILVGDLSRATYSNAEQAMRTFARVTLSDLALIVADELNSGLWPDGGLALEFDLSRAVRAPRKERYEALRIAVGGPWMEVNEARGEEDMEPVDWGDGEPPRSGVRLMVDEGGASEGLARSNGSRQHMNGAAPQPMDRGLLLPGSI